VLNGNRFSSQLGNCYQPHPIGLEFALLLTWHFSIDTHPIAGVGTRARFAPRLRGKRVFRLVSFRKA